MGGLSSWWKANKKLARQTEDFLKTTFLGDTGGIEGITKPKLERGTDLGKLRSEAEANGFNPLTVLRATGGQGFYNNQIPMGRLSSDAFFNVFDRIANSKNKYPPAPEIKENTITGKEILAPVKLSNGKLNSDQNTAIYDVVQDPVTLEYVTDGENVFSAKQKPLDNVWVDPWGRKWKLPFEDVEIDTVVMGSYLKALAAGYHAGDVTGKALREKLGQKFGWYGYPKPSAIKTSKLPPMDKYNEARKHGILNWGIERLFN